MEDLPGDRPMKYLVDIEDFLNDKGGLKTIDVLSKFLVLLKKAKKMVPRCLLLHVLNASENDVQSKFCHGDGWIILSGWLNEAKDECNESLIREILIVLKNLPVSVAVLKSSTCAKSVKQLAKQSLEVSSVVPPLARELVIQWMGTINESFKSKEKEKEKEQEQEKKEKDRGVHLKKHRHSSSDNAVPEPPLKKRKKEKERKRHDSEGSEGQAHVAKKEKRPALEDINSKMAAAAAEKHRKRELVEKDDPESKQRKRSTVKMLPHRMRTAGLEDSTEKAVVTKSRSEVLAAKKEKLEKPVVETSAPSIESMHQTIKVNVHSGHSDQPPVAEQRSPKSRRLSHEIHESNSFMNALNAAVGPTVIRKKKKSTPAGHATSPTSKTKPAEASKPDAGDKAKAEKVKEEDANSDCSSDSQGPKKSALAEIGSLINKKSVKKSVTWADEDNLREVRYFEMDETERVNVNRVGSMEEMTRKEHLLERQLFSRNAAAQHAGSSDGGAASPYGKGWYRPFSFEGQSCTTELGKNSREVAIQAERERHVLAALYFSKESVPDSAQEPDMAHEDYVDPVIVPLEDQTIIEAEAPSEAAQQPKEEEKPKADSPSASPPGDANSNGASKVIMSNENEFSLTPEVASLLKSITAGLSQPQNEAREAPEAQAERHSEAALNKPPANVEHAPAGRMEVPAMGNFKPPNHHQQPPPYNEKVWRVLRENYPNLNLDEISVDRMRQLLEPIQDQLRACGALNPPPNSYAMHGPGPGPYGPGGPRGGNGGPPHHAPHPHPHSHTHPPARPMHPGPQFGGPNGPPRPMGPGPQQGGRFPPGYGPQGPRHYGPPMPPHRPPPNFPNGHFKGPGGGGGKGQGNRMCRFFQNGACRSGPNCRFVHSHSGGPSHSPQDS